MSSFTGSEAKISLIRLSELRDTTPLATVIESFFISATMSPKTKEFYQTGLRSFARFVTDGTGREPILSDVNKEYVNQFLRHLEKAPTAAYPNGSSFRSRNAGSTLRRFANWLVEAEIISSPDGRPAVSPLKGIKQTKELKDVRQPLSDEEVEQVIWGTTQTDQAHALRDRTLIILLLGTGLRLNEVRELRIADLHLKDCQLVVRAETSKVGTGRTVDFHTAVQKELDRYLRSRDDLAPTDPLFPTDEGGVFSEGGIGNVMVRIATKSGVKRFHAHLCRHTWATNWMKEEGADLLQLKRQGGWTNMKMVERYSHSIPVRDRTVLPNPLAIGRRRRVA